MIDIMHTSDRRTIVIRNRVEVRRMTLTSTTNKVKEQSVSMAIL
jgi:hypothetical protein